MRTNRSFPFLIFFSIYFFLSCNKPVENVSLENVTLYHGGDIITMASNQPQYIDALVVKEGKIVFAGNLDEAKKTFPNPTLEVDLKGKTMLPGFIDAHGHIFNTGIQALAANLLPPPDGPGQNFASIISELNSYKNTEDGKLMIRCAEA